VQCDDIGVANGHSLQDSNLVTDLMKHWSAIVIKFKGLGYGRKVASREPSWFSGDVAISAR